MTFHIYAPTVPIDQNGNLVAEGSGDIYDPEDVTFARPLIPSDPNGAPLPGGFLSVTPLGLIPGFGIEGYPVVVWRSGNGAPVTLEATGARIPAGGSPGQVVRKASSADFDVEWGDAPTGGGGDDPAPAPAPVAPTVANMPAGFVMYVRKTTSTWPARPTNRTDLTVIWIGAEPSPALVSSGTGGMYSTDLRFVV